MDDCAFGADDVVLLRPEFRKRRFQLIRATSSANICIHDPVTVSQIRGRAKYILRRYARRAMQLWKTTPSGQRVRIAEGATDSTGYFVFSNVASGVYEIVFISAAARETFSVRVQGVSLFRWFPKNWLQVGLGFVQPEGCPPSYLQAIKEKHVPTLAAEQAAAADR